ncbi:hypothetical protein E2C01_037118 [Portunus trituberculatus]|uniref:Secreted protein n=1 Tax=Portunus trituberculatus TaxID=210409 RepID=A0A5B7F7A1_PORTR|nr:hypothetical protein [Portunus trituberculatus]
MSTSPHNFLFFLFLLHFLSPHILTSPPPAPLHLLPSSAASILSTTHPKAPLRLPFSSSKTRLQHLFFGHKSEYSRGCLAV